jgi:NADH-quinone oxidoreductase subunit D
MPELRQEVMTVNMGPQHPSTHGVLNIVVQLSGETIVSARTTIGFLHTGIEKTAEQKKWQQVIPLVERMDYLAAQSNSLAFCLSVERLLGVEGSMPQRVKDIRILLVELQRIASHLVSLGTHALEVGAVSVLMYCLSDREKIMNLNEMIAGFRMFPSYIRVGGLREDLPPGFHEAVDAFLNEFPSKVDEYERLLTKNQIWLKRTRGVGIISKDDHIQYGLVGPMARAIGVPYDVRKQFPYLGYETYEFEIPTQTHGDVYDRFLVRMEELRQSTRILEQAIKRLPDGPVNIDDHRVILPLKSKATSDMESMIHHFKQVMEGPRPPIGESYVAVESPKGEKGYYMVSDGTSKPVRWRIRPPSFVNLSAIPKMVEGHLLSDVIAINASIDIVMGEIDR